MTFKRAVMQTPKLENSWRPRLKALRREDRPHVKPQSSRRLRGSTDVDTALRRSQPDANRWDFAVGYDHANRKEDCIYWIETHTGSDDQIEVVLKKLEWLKKWLRKDGRLLDRFERDIVWVSSGHTLFTQGSAQVKLLAQKGLIYAGAVLRIRDTRQP